MIKINLGDKVHLIEFGKSSALNISNPTQCEIRQTTGLQLIEMLAMNRLLQRQFEIKLSNFPNIALKYKPGIDDCETYMKKILASLGEPPTQISRFSNKDSQLGRNLGTAFNFFSPRTENAKSLESSLKFEENTHELPQNKI